MISKKGNKIYLPLEKPALNSSTWEIIPFDKVHSITSEIYSSKLEISTAISLPPNLSSISWPGRVKSKVKSVTVAPLTWIASIAIFLASSVYKCKRLVIYSCGL